MKCCASLKGRTGFAVVCLIVSLVLAHMLIMFDNETGEQDLNIHKADCIQQARLGEMQYRWKLTRWQTCCFYQTSSSDSKNIQTHLSLQMNILTLISPVKFWLTQCFGLSVNQI